MTNRGVPFPIDRPHALFLINRGCKFSDCGNSGHQTPVYRPHVHILVNPGCKLLEYGYSGHQIPIDRPHVLILMNRGCKWSDSGNSGHQIPIYLMFSLRWTVDLNYQIQVTRAILPFCGFNISLLVNLWQVQEIRRLSRRVHCLPTEDSNHFWSFSSSSNGRGCFSD